MHAPFVASQTGLAPGHSELAEQPHVLVPGRQIGFVPVQAPPLPTEHSTHSPLRQMPLAGFGHGAELAEPLSPLHAPHVFVDMLQTGLVAGQFALEPHVHVLLTVLQTGAVAEQAVALEAEHCWQRPATQAGNSGVAQARDAVDP